MEHEPERTLKNAVQGANSKYTRRTRGLLLTYQCNLNCVYCYAQNKSDKVMPLEIAQTAIADVFCAGREPGVDEIEIDFIGAEPLTAFERLQAISEWVWRQRWCKPYILFATTNGTRLTAEMKRWFSHNRQRIYLGLSYDGIAETQNRNRSNSAGSIDLDFFLENWPGQHLKMTITEATVTGCQLFIMQVLANCKYYARLFLTKKELTPEERATAYAVKKIHQILGRVKKEANCG